MARSKQRNPAHIVNGVITKSNRKINPKTGKCVHRYRPGTRAIIEIRKQQKKSTEFANSFAPMNRLIREIASDSSSTIRFTKNSVRALIESSEELIIDILGLSNYLAIEIGKRKGVGINDFRMATRFCMYPHTLKGDLQNIKCVHGKVIKEEGGQETVVGLPRTQRSPPKNRSAVTKNIPVEKKVKEEVKEEEPVADTNKDDDDDDEPPIDELEFGEEQDF